MAAAITLPRPDLAPHRESLRLPLSTIVGELVSILGRKLTAYIGKVKDVRAVDRWMAGGEVYGDAEQRLRFAFQVARTLHARDTPAVVQSLVYRRHPGVGRPCPIAADSRRRPTI